MKISNSTLTVFDGYVNNVLAQHGFSLITPQLAERRSAGLRQGILLEIRDTLGDVWLYASTYSVFTHELDDGPTHERPATSEVIAGVCSGNMGSREGGLRSTLTMMTDIFLPNLLRYGTVDVIVQNVERYPGSASMLLGSSPIAAEYNLAHCLETVGRISDAKALYFKTAERLEASDDALARAYCDAARRRVRALEGADIEEHSAYNEEHSLAPQSSGCAATSACAGLELSNADEPLRQFYAGLLERLENARVNPVTNFPTLLVRTADELYEPRPGFWKAVSADAMMTVIKTYEPDFERRMAALSPTALEEYREDLDGALYMRSFDETAAERLLELPTDTRPANREDIYSWLIDDFGRRGEDDELEYLERDGLKGADGVINAMALLSNAT